MQDNIRSIDSVSVSRHAQSDKSCPDCGKAMRETSTDGVCACDGCRVVARVDGKTFADGTTVRRGPR